MNFPAGSLGHPVGCEEKLFLGRQDKMSEVSNAIENMTFAMRSDLVERKPETVYECESLDYGQQYIVDEVFYVVGCQQDGQQWAHQHRFSQKVDAEQLLHRIREAADGNVCIDMKYWYEIAPAYGSLAYENNASQMVSDETKLDVESEYGAGSYSYGTPGFIG